MDHGGGPWDHGGQVAGWGRVGGHARFDLVIAIVKGKRNMPKIGKENVSKLINQSFPVKMQQILEAELKITFQDRFFRRTHFCITIW